METAGLATHLALYPAAALRRRAHRDDAYSLGRLPPLQRGLLVRAPDTATTPVLLVHGLIDNRSVFTRLRHDLRRRGLRRVVPVELPLRTASVEDGARLLATAVTAAAGDDGRVQIVAHSLGGLVARYYVQRLGGDRRVSMLITLATPHGGTRLAELVPRALPYPLLAQLRPDSPLLTDLAGPAPDCRTRFVAVGAALDTVVRPAQAALRHPDLTAVNLTVPGHGHHSLAFSGAVCHLVAGWLAGTARPECSEFLDGSPPPPRSELLDGGVAQQQPFGPGVRAEVDRRLGRVPHPADGNDDAEAEAVVRHPVTGPQLDHGTRRRAGASGERRVR
ncbi:putative secreted lipase [Frankia canadensis]|uniref:Putative secreted lipase n=1 Tax=Frankia canadensis TaxID=1836972 RepID=A0A2I2KQJ0_9ACTN|nr:putative secreted lipase [Frankia canadensis]SOU55227.1 putative secreted lipase [Frankia canadensis]